MASEFLGAKTKSLNLIKFYIYIYIYIKCEIITYFRNSWHKIGVVLTLILGIIWTHICVMYIIVIIFKYIN